MTGDLARAASTPNKSLKRMCSRVKLVVDKAEEEDEGVVSLEWTHISTGLLLVLVFLSESLWETPEITGRLNEPSNSKLLGFDCSRDLYKVNTQDVSLWDEVRSTEPSMSRDKTPSSGTTRHSEEICISAGNEEASSEEL